MKIYTRGGDTGQTSLIGARTAKDDVRVEAYGAVDELNSFVGQAISVLDDRCADLKEHLIEIQHELFDCGADLSLAKQGTRPYRVHAEMTKRLEELIDRYDAECPEIRCFILPGGTQGSALLHVCRTVCRRAERRIVTLARQQSINEEIRRYINRLSDFFFVAARVVNVRAGIGDVEYIRSEEVFRAKGDSNS